MRATTPAQTPPRYEHAPVRGARSSVQWQGTTVQQETGWPAKVRSSVRRLERRRSWASRTVHSERDRVQEPQSIRRRRTRPGAAMPTVRPALSTAHGVSGGDPTAKSIYWHGGDSVAAGRHFPVRVGRPKPCIEPPLKRGPSNAITPHPGGVETLACVLILVALRLRYAGQSVAACARRTPWKVAEGQAGRLRRLDPSGSW